MADVSVSIAWVPTLGGKNCIFQGYTAVAGDGGIGTISGGGSVSICDGDQAYVQFIDLHLTNSGAAQLLDMGSYNSFIRCEVDTSSFNGSAIDCAGMAHVVGCKIISIIIQSV